MRGFSSDAVEYREQNRGSSIRLDAVNESARWWVMTQFNFNRPLSDPAWAPGLVQTFTPGTTSPEGLSVNLIGCSGPRRDNYTYDGAPTRVTVHVQEGSSPGSKLVSFAAYWGGNGSVTGSFEYEPR